MTPLRFLAFLACCLTAESAQAACTAPYIAKGMDKNGMPTSDWLAAIRPRVDPAELRRISNSPRPFSPEEVQWQEAVRRASVRICQRFSDLNSAFPAVVPPRRVRLLIGNQAGDDAFTSGRDTIVLDLKVFAEAYASSNDRDALIDRILLHEYSHLLINPYLALTGWSEQWADQDPFLRAIRTLFNEGIGNLRSIQDSRWVAEDGLLTPSSTAVLEALEPIMLERLQRLEARPSREEAANLLRNISQGPFTKKWGAVPIALWLQAETRGSPAQLRSWVRHGPQAILSLAVRNSSPKYRRQFEQLLESVPNHVQRAQPKRS